MTEMNDTSGRWSYARQLYGHVYTAKIGTLSELVTAGDQFNQQHITLAGYEKETQTPADELAASRTARAAVFIRNDRRPVSWWVCCLRRRGNGSR